MLDLRTTPVDSKLPSPAEMLMGRQAYHHIASFPHLSISRHCCTTSTFGSQTVDDEVQLWQTCRRESPSSPQRTERQGPGQSKQDLDTGWSHRTQRRTKVLQRENKPGVQHPTQQRRLERSSPTGLCRHWKPAWCDNPDSSSANPTGNSLCHPSGAWSCYWSRGWTTFAVWSRDR